MGKVISFYSYKGGTGRTTTAANVAYQLSKAGKKVMCIDLDIDGPGMHAVFNIPDGSELQEKNIVKYFSMIESKSYKEFVFDISTDFQLKSTLHVIPATMNIDRENALDTMGQTLPDKLDELILEIKDKYDYIIIDTASGVSDYSVLAFSVSDIIIICFKWSRQHVLGTLKISKLLSLVKKENLYPLENWHIVATSVASATDEFEKKRKALVIDIIKDKLNKNILYEVPEISKQKWTEEIIDDDEKIQNEYSKLANLLI